MLVRLWLNNIHSRLGLMNSESIGSLGFLSFRTTELRLFSTSTLAELMLPDGAHLRPEDWTIFYLNQTRANAVAPVLAHESPGRHLSPTSVSSMSYLDMLDANAKAGSVEMAVDGSAQPKTSAAQKSGVGEMLFVLNCVRMKEDKTARR